MIGINISGAEFGGTGGTHNSQYHYPTLSELQFYKDHGVDLVRLPFTWERMQKSLGGPLDPQELALLKGVLADAATLGLDLIIDLHNYGRYNGQPLGGSTGPTDAQFADFWQKLATALKGYSSLLGYDLMNEPHDMPTPDAWKNAAQAAVNAIRQVDTDNIIYVEGNDWAGAHSWMNSNANFFINDPANKLIYQAHQYFDKYNQGFYNNSYDDEGAYPMVGVDRLKPFVDWLKANNLKGMIGEFGVPSNDPRWLEVQKNAIDYMNANNLDATAWGGGTWWPSDYSMYMGAPGRADSAYFNQLEGFFGQYDGPATVTPPPPPPPSIGTIRGTDNGETINSTPANDVIDALGGNDTINGTGGADVVDGGSGIDTMSYHWSGAHVDVDLKRATQHNGDATGDRLTNIENLRGSAHNDYLHGDDLANVIDGLGGRDVMSGRGGSDTFVFSSAAEANGDVILDYSSADRLDFSAFAAALSLSNNGVDTVIAGDTNGDGQNDFNVTLKGVHTTVNGLSVTPPPPPPPSIGTIRGTDNGETINSTPANDVIDALGGNDTINGTGGADVVDGGSGIDTMSYHWSGAHVDVDLKRATQHNGDATGDRLTNIENLRGSAHNDYLHGDDLANVIDGLGGRDVMSGRGGSDTFVFSSAAEANGDVILDYSSADRLDFSAFAAALSLSNNGVDTVIAGDTNGDGQNDFNVTLKGVHTTVNGLSVTPPPAPVPAPFPAVSIDDVTVNENVGTMTFTLTRSGSLTNPSTVKFATANGTAVAGSDYTAATGTVTFAAGETVKTISISVINDTLIDGKETLVVNLTGGLNVTISDGQGIATIISDDGAVLTSPSRNPVNGTAGADILTGPHGADTISENDGLDVLNGGGGADRLTGGTRGDRFVFDTVANARGDRLTAFRLNEDKLDFSRIDANSIASGDQAFTFIELRDFPKVAGELRSYLNREDTLISTDVDGDGIPDFSVMLSGIVAVSSMILNL